jgi:type VII secretion-associated protein (TIGR03931 family)
VTAHRAIVEAGPGAIRRICCSAGRVADPDMPEVLDAALGSIDDPVALVGGRPVAVDSLWRAALRSLSRTTQGALILHPSWWSSSRVGVVSAAAEDLPGEVVVHPRSWLVARACDANHEAVVVEIAERLVAIVGPEIAAVSRTAEPPDVAEAIVSVIGEMCSDATVIVLIDVPTAIAGARELATLIAHAVRDSGQSVVEIDETRLLRLAVSAQSAVPEHIEPSRPPAAPRAPSRTSKLRGFAAATVVLAAAVPVVAGVGHHGVAPTTAAPTTFLVEGRVTLMVPTNWTAQRVLAGPGSARVQVTSPTDPETALHVTQSPVPPDETLSATAERLRRAIGSEDDGVFVDFNPSGVSAGRAAVTYREVRANHQVRWTVVLDGPVRISVGCQNRPGGEDAVRDVCEQAVRSAHAIG